MKYRLAIFDLDGTILNTLEDLAGATNYTMDQFSFPRRTIEEVRRFVGNGIRNLILRAAPAGTPDEMIDRMHRVFIAYYDQHCADRTRPYDGIVELLSALRRDGVHLAVVSNKTDQAVKPLCKQYFGEIFDEAIGERVGVQRKPAPDTVNEVLKSLQIGREEAVYIGDSEVDVRTAQNAEMDCIAVNWGFRSTEELLDAGATTIAANPDELYTYLR